MIPEGDSEENKRKIPIRRNSIFWDLMPYVT
jgi:hypothetical protein